MFTNNSTVHMLLNHKYLAGDACKISDFQMWLYVQTTGHNIKKPVKVKTTFTYVLFLRVLSKPNSSDSLLQKKQSNQLYS